MSSSASNEAYNTLIKLWDKLTRLNSVITLEAVDKLKDELGGIFTVAKTHCYTQGQKYSHLASESSSRPPRANARPPLSWPNYICRTKRTTIFHLSNESQGLQHGASMLAFVNIYRPEYTLSEDLGLLNYTSNPTKPMAKFTVMPQQMSMWCLPMAWFCEMANSVIGEGGELLEYKQLIANPKT
jgi:hypothetical protein